MAGPAATADADVAGMLADVAGLEPWAAQITKPGGELVGYQCWFCETQVPPDPTQTGRYNHPPTCVWRRIADHLDALATAAALEAAAQEIAGG